MLAVLVTRGDIVIVERPREWCPPTEAPPIARRIDCAVLRLEVEALSGGAPLLGEDLYDSTRRLGPIEVRGGGATSYLDALDILSADIVESHPGVGPEGGRAPAGIAPIIDADPIAIAARLTRSRG